VRDNDPKGTAAFMRASLEYEALLNIDFDPHAGEVRPIAFPGAEGGGKYTTGGRGGRVIYVTSLADDGSEGTFRHAVEQEGARTVLFAVAGTIFLRDKLVVEPENGNLTIVGQSAPGEGICIAGNSVTIEADNVIVRYLRFRLGDAENVEGDAFGGKSGSNVIIDHCSVSWSTDECASFYAMRNFTMQWCVVSEALNSSVHKKGNHGYGAIWGGRNATFHHNLFAHNNSRNPRLDHPSIYPRNLLVTHRGSVDFVNNVIYNWGNTASYGGERGWWNFENNLFKAGPASKNPHRQFTEVSVSLTTSMTPGRYFIAGNVLDGAPEISADNWSGVHFDEGFTRADVDNGSRFPLFVDTPRESAATAYESVLAEAGASHRRDAVDSRIMNEVRTATATYTGSVSGRPGIIDSQNDVGGWPELRGGKAPKDTDRDGMPDRWERHHGLDARNPADGAELTAEGYTNLEIYLNSIVAE
jgi:pectate lyase